MTIENLRCFLTLAQELNFTRAAQKAHITQTAMSRKITSLETELSIQLFHRNHHQVGLTSAGQEFYNHIRPVLDQYDAAVLRAQNMDKDQRDSVQIGVGVYEHTLVSPVIQNFIQQYPIQKLNFVQFKYRELLEWCQRVKTDKVEVMATLTDVRLFSDGMTMPEFVETVQSFKNIGNNAKDCFRFNPIMDACQIAGMPALLSIQFSWEVFNWLVE